MRWLFALMLLPSLAAAQTTITLTGDYAYTDYRPGVLAPYTYVNAWAAQWTLATSTQATPTGQSGGAAGACDDPAGPLPVNRYPIQLEDAPGVRVSGALILGEVNQTTAWRPTYCNSSAITLDDSPNGMIANARIDAGWDGFRATESSANSHNFQVRSSWLTRMRDDCMENDKFYNGIVIDVLCESFTGFSMADNGATSHSTSVGTFSGVLHRNLSYIYETEAGSLKHGAPMKMATFNMKTRIFNSVFVIDNASLVSNNHFPRMWASIISCRNNVLVWASDAALPAGVGTVPACFRIVTGATAGEAFWARAKQNWIDCHPNIRRVPGDPASTPANCDRTFYGGMY